jgi:protein-S-isoprenylcysteine O-methyltransferase
VVHALRAVILVAFFAWMLADNAIVFSKSRRSAQRADRLSLLVIAITNWTALWVGISLAYRGVGVPAQRAASLQLAGLAVFVCGAAFRWVAIFQLGRFHMPTVAILEGHHVVDTGLYRHIRHPSYLGAILAFLGLGLGLGSWVSAVVIIGVVTVGYLYRISAEERALIAGLGEAYVEYRRRTRRLIPGVF